MTRRVVSRRLALSVGQRLFLGLLPSLLAVALVVGLAYYGEYERQAPGRVVLGAAVLALASLAMTWVNTRYLASRITRLAGTGARGTPAPTNGADELDRIEQVVDQLGSALTASEAERAQAEAAATTRLREHATLLSATVRATIAQLDEVRLPLHILLEAKFGELNENQEELLGTARDGADAMDAALRRLGQIADADRGALPVQRALVQVNDVVRAALPLARAAAVRRGASVDARLEPGLPRVWADGVRLAEALALILESAGEATGAGQVLTITTARAGGATSIDISLPATARRGEDRTAAAGQDDPSGGVGVMLAARLIAGQGGRLAATPTTWSVRLT